MLRIRKGEWTGLNNEDGSAMVIALLIMILLMGFVALAVTRTNSETMASANDATESRTFDAANASLEIMTRNFDKIFDTKLNPDPADLARVISQEPPGFPEYTFTATANRGGQNIQPTGPAKPVIMKGGDFQGLNALQDEWQLDTVATHTATGVQVALRRRFLNNRIPIFQFGIFYDDDMEFHPGPVFNFGGRVHSNGNIFLSAGSGLYFASKVTAHNNVFTDVGKNGKSYTTWGDQVYVRNGSGTPVRVDHTDGSVLTSPINGSPVPNYPSPLPPAPTAYANASWPTIKGQYDGNLLANQQELKLPIKINAQINNRPVDLVELVKRGKSVDTTAGTGDLWNDRTGTVAAPVTAAVTAANQDDPVTKSERYYNKTGIRVSLADSKAKLPGCATSTGSAITTKCGVRLDADPTGQVQGAYAPGPSGRGYNPSLGHAMTGAPAYAPTEINGERMYSPGKESWIKIETVVYNATTQKYDTVDITEDILSLGVTERAPNIAGNFTITDSNYSTLTNDSLGVPTGTDSRSVIKLQQFMMRLPAGYAGIAINNTAGAVAPNNFMLNTGFTGGIRNFVQPAGISNASCATATTAQITAVNQGAFPNGLTTTAMVAAKVTPDRPHWKTASITGGTANECVVAFPINIFDTREGLFNESTGVFNRDGAYKVGSNYNVPWAGVMSMVDLDIANLKRFLSGDFDGGTKPGLPASGTKFSDANSRALKSTDIPSANGWVLYVSDRRGDRDFDGEYDMEDIFGNNDNVLQLGEDINGDGVLQADYTDVGGAQEAAKYSASGLFSVPAPAAAPVVPAAWKSYVSPDVAATFEHPFYRRGVRVVNGSDLPGGYDTTTPANTKGFTIASENGVYVLGNYNATGVASYGSPTPSTDFLPQGARDVPASIAADAVTILSNKWSDANSFTNAFTFDNRNADTETTTRFAMLAGDSVTTIDATPNQGGQDTRMNGGVHNFIRFLEDWSVRLNYCGSLINLYNAHNNNGTYKNGGGAVYAPPTRNWVFDASFLDINRIPPGTPFFQQIQITGFQRINN